MTRALSVAVAMCLCSCVRAQPEAEMKDPDAWLFVAQGVRTMDPSRPTAKAFSVRDGKFVTVGTYDEVRADPVLAGLRVAEVQLPGFVVPGIEDSHGHLASLGRSLVIADLIGAKSEQDAVARMAQAGKDSHEGDWLVGRGWDQNEWPRASDGGQPFPTKASLDGAFANVAVYLTRVDGHAAWVSSEALRRAGVTAATKDPEGGRLVRDGKGEPTGVLIDNAMDLVREKLPAPSDDQRRRRLDLALRHVAANGITVVHDAGMDLATFKLLQALDAMGELPIRVYALADGQGAEADRYLEQGPFSGRMLTMKAVKLLMDGALGSRGAALYEDYSDAKGEKGLLLMSDDALFTKTSAFMKAGFQVAVHAIGDRANTKVIDAFSEAIHATGGGPGRPRLEHAQVLLWSDVERLAQLGIIASMQPIHASSDMKWAPERLGPQRIKGAYAWKNVLDSGAHLCFGSDFPIEDSNPLFGIYAARTRQDEDGKPAEGWLPEQRLTGEQALRAYTVEGAYASFAEKQRGMIAPGMDADFSAFTVDPVEAPAVELLKAETLMTFVAGKAAFVSDRVR